MRITVLIIFFVLLNVTLLGAECSTVFPGNESFATNSSSSINNSNECNGGNCSTPPTFSTVSSLPTLSTSGSFTQTTIVDGVYQHTNWGLGKDAKVTFSGSGTAVIYFSGNVVIPKGTELNKKGNPENVLIIVYGNLTIEKDAEINAVIYVVGDAVLQKEIEFQGAISASGALDVAKEGEYDFSSSYIDNLDSKGFCGTVVTSVDHYEIIHDGSGSTCASESVLIKACKNASCSTLVSGPITLDFQIGGSTVSSTNFTGSTTINVSHTTEETVTFSLTNESVTADNNLVCNNGTSSSCDMVFSSASCPVAGSCAVYFPDTIQGHDAASSIKFKDTGQVINDPDNILTFPTLTNETAAAHNTCNTADCTVTGSTTPAFTLPTFITTSTTTDIILNSGTATIGPGGDYSITEINQLNLSGTANITFLASASTYLIDNALFDGSSQITFNPGNYWFNELEIIGSANIIINGPVTIFVNGQSKHFDIEDGATINVGGAASDLAIVSYEKIHLKDNVVVKAVLYSIGKDVKLQDNAQLTGAISASQKVEIKDTSSVIYENISNVQVADLCGGSYEATAIAHYSMDEASWGSVIDVIGGYNGTAYNGADTVGTSCRYGQFDGINDYVQIPHNAALNGTNALTYVAYIRPDSWTGIDQIMAKSVHGGGSGRAQMGIFSENGVFKGRAETNTGRYEIQSTLPAVAGDWVQVALVFDGTTLTLYQNGAAVATTGFSSSTLNQTTDPLNISKRVGTDQYYFHGLIDDVRVYTTALSAQEILDLYNTVTPCSLVSVDHLLISHAGSALTCTGETLTIKACANADCSSVATSDVEVTLSATGDTSIWSSNPVTIPANSNSGVDISLTHRTAETITLSTSSTPAAANALVCSPVGCDIAFAEAGFILTLDNHQSCSVPNLTIQAVKLSETGTSCAPAYTGIQPVNFSFDYSNPASGSLVPILASTNMAAATVVQNRSITFDGSASASLSFQYNDAGQLSITVADATNSGLSSASITPTITPAKLIVSTTDTGNACTADYGNCSTFKVAGVVGNAASEFNLNVAGACSDNTITPNFQLANIPLSTSLIAPNPSVGTNATLGVTSVDIISGGTVTVTQTISEVGAFTITATPSTYFGQTIPIATSSTIGRFVPDRFSVSVNSPTDTPYFANASCGFTYQDQAFGFGASENPVITITALNSAGAVTRNYGGAGVANNDFWKLDATKLATRSYSNQVAAFPGSLDFSLLSSTIVIAGATNYDGINTFSIEGDLLTYSKSSATPITTDDANFDALVTLNFTAESLTDTDGVFYDSDNNNLRDNSIDDFDITDISNTNIRWGRWFIENAFGSELQPLVMTAEAQYFDGTNFVINTSDDCSATITTITPTLTNYTGNLADGETSLSSGTMVSGLLPFNLSAPGNGNDGSLLLTVPEPDWLMYDYDGDGTADDASATATFGIFEGRKPVIFWRQKY